VARKAKEKGAWLVIVHGETIVEPVERGTNRAAVQCPDVDILAHPGLLTLEEARLAAANNIFIEVSARKGHSLTNGLVVRIAGAAGAKLILNSDAHDESDLLTPSLARNILLGSGLTEGELDRVLSLNARALMERLQPKV
jgi:histidinol phosphatase-like PHP family hydrolase